MPNEITINIPSITYVKGIYNDTRAFPAPITLDVAGEHAVHEKQALSTSAADLAKGNIGTIGFFLIVNLDGAINALVSVGTTDFFTIKPGKIMLGYANTTAIKAKSDSGTPNLEYWLIEA